MPRSLVPPTCVEFLRTAHEKDSASSWGDLSPARRSKSAFDVGLLGGHRYEIPELVKKAGEG